MRRRRVESAPAISGAMLHAALYGWIEGTPGPEDGDPLEPFLLTHAQWGAFYRTHQAYIDAAARTRGVATPWAAGLEGTAA